MRRGNPLIRMIMLAATNKQCVYPTSLFLLRNEEIAVAQGAVIARRMFKALS